MASVRFGSEYKQIKKEQLLRVKSSQEGQGSRSLSLFPEVLSVAKRRRFDEIACARRLLALKIA